MIRELFSNKMSVSFNMFCMKHVIGMKCSIAIKNHNRGKLGVGQNDPTL